MNTIHLEILSDAQRKLWENLGNVAAMGFTLYGGTALALQLNHRHSIDFDFFSSKPLDSSGIIRSLPDAEKITIERDEERTLQLTTASGVHLSFFGKLAIHRVAEPLIAEGIHLKIASLDDLMATKIKVLFNRVECKDYKDLAEMIRYGVSLSKGLASAKAIYGNSFQPMVALKAITYFEGGDLIDLSNSDRNVLIQAAKMVDISELDNIQLYDL